MKTPPFEPAHPKSCCGFFYERVILAPSVTADITRVSGTRTIKGMPLKFYKRAPDGVVTEMSFTPESYIEAFENRGVKVTQLEIVGMPILQVSTIFLPFRIVAPDSPDSGYSPDSGPLWETALLSSTGQVEILLRHNTEAKAIEFHDAVVNVFGGKADDSGKPEG